MWLYSFLFSYIYCKHLADLTQMYKPVTSFFYSKCNIFEQLLLYSCIEMPLIIM